MEMTVIDTLLLSFGALGLGIIMLLRGGNWTIDAAVYVAKKLNISPLLIGFTIVAFGTSLPELIVSINANFQGLPGIAVGNVVGSNIANILLVIGAAATVAAIHGASRSLTRDLSMMIFVSIVFTALLLLDALNHMAGFALVAVLVSYTVWQYVMARKGEIAVEEIEETGFTSMGLALLTLLGGLIFVALGAEFLVRGAKTSAEILGVPDALIGLTIIAIGTSLPELTTCLVAAAKKQSDLILGNIVGSNVFNILMIMGLTASLKPIDVSLVGDGILRFDIWFMLGISFVFALLMFFAKQIGRFWGTGFLVLYACYIIFLAVSNMPDPALILE